MKFIKKFDYYITAVFIITIIIIVATSFFTFSEIFARSHQKQQAAIMPLFSLITSEIIRPITVSQYMASDPFLLDYIQQDEIDNDVVFNYISNISTKFNALSFIALEKHQLLIDSTNKVTDLRNEKAEWYHRLKKSNKTEFTDFGNVENPHLFFDVKMFNKQQEFLGFVGLAVDLDHFSTQFKIFKKDFGFEVYFIDENNTITLSSSQLMKTTFHHRTDNLININDLEWYQSYQSAQQNNMNTSIKSNNNSIFSFSNDHLLVSKILLRS